MGRKVAEGRIRGNWRVDKETPSGLSEIAMMLGFTYGGSGAVGKLLDAIAVGDYLIIPKPTTKKKTKGG